MLPAVSDVPHRHMVKVKVSFGGKMCLIAQILREWTPVKEVERDREQTDMLLIARGGETNVEMLSP